MNANFELLDKKKLPSKMFLMVPETKVLDVFMPNRPDRQWCCQHCLMTEGSDTGFILISFKSQAMWEAMYCTSSFILTADHIESIEIEYKCFDPCCLCSSELPEHSNVLILPKSLSTDDKVALKQAWKLIKNQNSPINQPQEWMWDGYWVKWREAGYPDNFEPPDDAEGRHWKDPKWTC